MNPWLAGFIGWLIGGSSGFLMAPLFAGPKIMALEGARWELKWRAGLWRASWGLDPSEGEAEWMEITK